MCVVNWKSVCFLSVSMSKPRYCSSILFLFFLKYFCILPVESQTWYSDLCCWQILPLMHHLHVVFHYNVERSLNFHVFFQIESCILCWLIILCLCSWNLQNHCNLIAWACSWLFLFFKARYACFQIKIRK